MSTYENLKDLVSKVREEYKLDGVNFVLFPFKCLTGENRLDHKIVEKEVKKTRSPDTKPGQFCINMVAVKLYSKKYDGLGIKYDEGDASFGTVFNNRKNVFIGFCKGLIDAYPKLDEIYYENVRDEAIKEGLKSKKIELGIYTELWKNNSKISVCFHKSKTREIMFGSNQRRNRSDKTELLLMDGLLSAILSFSDEIPTVDFPGKIGSQLSAEYIYGVLHCKYSPSNRIDVIGIGDKSVGKTTIFKHWLGEKHDGATTNWYDLYMAPLEGDKPVVIWDLGGQKQFRLFGQKSLPKDLISQIKFRIPPVIVFTFASHEPKTLDELRGFSDQCKSNMNPKDWGEAYRLLFETFIDKQSAKPKTPEEIKQLTEEFKLHKYIQLNAKEEVEIIKKELDAAFREQQKRYS